MLLLDSKEVQTLAKIVEESTRSTREGVKYFIEPAPGTLARAKNKRHHIVFGRRGSGKSSLLAKVTEDLTVNRTPTAYVDLEQFKGHSYPDAQESPHFFGGLRLAEIPRQILRMSNHIAPTVS
jgi:hypothetical protein